MVSYILKEFVGGFFIFIFMEFVECFMDVCMDYVEDLDWIIDDFGDLFVLFLFVIECRLFGECMVFDWVSEMMNIDEVMVLGMEKVLVLCLFYKKDFVWKYIDFMKFDYFWCFWYLFLIKNIGFGFVFVMLVLIYDEDEIMRMYGKFRGFVIICDFLMMNNIKKVFLGWEILIFFCKVGMINEVIRLDCDFRL